jgi:hypothetical protein
MDVISTPSETAIKWAWYTNEKNDLLRTVEAQLGEIDSYDLTGIPGTIHDAIIEKRGRLEQDRQRAAEAFRSAYHGASVFFETWITD